MSEVVRLSLSRLRAPFRLALAALAVGAVLIARSPELAAHDHVLRHVAWPQMHRVYDQNERPTEIPWRDMTFVVKPIRVDVDETAPGTYGLRAVRLHVRSLTAPYQEQTIAWEAPLFPSEDAMKSFAGALRPLMGKPIFSLRARVIPDPESPKWNKRWRAVELPTWAETPIY